MNFDIIIRAVSVYIFIILSIRLFGKKELAQLSVIDLVFILLISNAVQNAMVGPDTTLTGGLIAATALFFTNFILKKLTFYFKPLSKFLQGEPILLIYKGKINFENLKKAGITLDEIEAAVREHGVEGIKNVDIAMFEIDGNISVLSDDFKKKTTKKRRAHKMLNTQQ
jgi:uncharacterized membrane protein YcaP (DUF421 family)